MTDDRRQTKDKRQQKALLLVALVTLIAFALRVFRLDSVSLRGDEAFTVIFVQRTWEGLWRGIRFIEPNPPLMYLALRVWVALAGASEFATRYFAAFFGVLCVPLLYRLAREIFSGTVIARSAVGDEAIPTVAGRLLRSARNDQPTAIALLAAALIAINPYQIWHSQDVRNYTLWPALSLLALVFFWQWIKREWGIENRENGIPNPQSLIPVLIFYVLATLASLYTHYFDAFILVAENIFVFAILGWTRRWKSLARWIAAQMAVAAVYLPWVFIFSNRATAYGEGSAEQSVSLLDQFSRTLAAFVLGDTVPDLLKTLAWLPLALALVIILICLARQDRTRALFLFLIIAVPTLALYAVSIGRPLFLERYLNGGAPAYYLAFAMGIVSLWGWKAQWKALAFAIAILFFASTSAYALSNYYFDPAYAKAPDWRALAQFIAVRQQPDDIVVQNFTEMSAIYYRSDKLPVITLPKEYRAVPDDEKRLRQLNQDYRRIWFIPAAPDYWDPDQSVEKYLSRSDDREMDTRISTFRVQLYLTPREFESKIIPVNARVGTASLVGYRLQGSAQNHATLRVVLYWHAEQKIEKDFTVFVHLADAGDRVIAQQDNAPVNGTYPTSQWQPGDLIVDSYDLKIDAVAGTYMLIVGMYDPATFVRLPALDPSGTRVPNDRVLLTPITIAP